jgi:hypothetical protein
MNSSQFSIFGSSLAAPVRAAFFILNLSLAARELPQSIGAFLQAQTQQFAGYVLRFFLANRQPVMQPVTHKKI